MQADVDQTLDILLAVSKQKLHDMQRNLSKVWHRLRYSSSPMLHSATMQVIHDNVREKKGAKMSAQHRDPIAKDEYIDPGTDDAFKTIMQWLYSRLNSARAN